MSRIHWPLLALLLVFSLPVHLAAQKPSGAGAPPDGDLNRDGRVDINDRSLLAAWLAGNGTLPCPSEDADWDRNGEADLGDLICLCLRQQSLGRILCVDSRNTSGQADGTALHPYPSLQTALDAAESGATLAVATGTYSGAFTIRDRSVRLMGGFAGALPEAYSSGSGGDFLHRNPDTFPVTLQGSPSAATLTVINLGTRPDGKANTYGTVIDGFRITGGLTGVCLDAAYSWPHPSGATISRCVIEGNGSRSETQIGGGILVNGDDVSLLDNIIRNNEAGRGPAVARGEENLLLRSNTIEGNRAYGDHGGGVYLTGRCTLENNLIRNNAVACSYGWGGGVLVLGQALLRGNRILSNSAPSMGGGIFVDEGGEAWLEHEIVAGNRTTGNDSGGAAILVDGGIIGEQPVGSRIHMDHCTVVGNSSAGTRGGNGIHLTFHSTADIRNSIFWNNPDGDFFHDEEAGPFQIEYTLSGSPVAGTGNLCVDPLLAAPDTGDFHLRSRAGRWLPGTGWVRDALTSPAIDAADPAAPFSCEPSPNGGRANLGAFGNTAEASLSPIHEKRETP